MLRSASVAPQGLHQAQAFGRFALLSQDALAFRIEGVCCEVHAALLYVKRWGRG